MSRPTLKLPAKSAAGDGESRPASRKPVRGGIKGARPVARPPAAARTVVDQRPVQEDASAPRVEVEVAKTPAPEQAVARNKKAPVPRQARAPAPPKVYPKRGIARSTGVRASPPQRFDEERSVSRVEPERISFAPPAPPPEPVLPTRPEAQPVARTPESKASRGPQSEPPRLSKRISEMYQCSRREADEWIENGWVRVDGAVVTTLGARVHPKAKVEIKEEASKHKTESVTILLNKPVEMASQRGESDGETALQLIRPETRWAEDDTRINYKASHLRGLALAGKLDTEATGMLVFTQEGSVARRIVGDDARLEKEYMVRVEGELTPDGLKLLNHGLALDDVRLKPAQVSWQNEQQLRFVLHESKKRQIQRMCELVGLQVTGIKRIRIGSVSLGKLPAGQWRYLRENERF